MSDISASDAPVSRPAAGGPAAESLANDLELRLGQFLRELGHELGNLAFPLQMILDLQGRSAQLSPEETNVALRAHVAELQQLTRRMQWIGRCLTGALEPRREPLVAAEVARAAAANCRRETEERRVTTQLLLSAEPLTLWADRELLQQALIELLHNAARHSPEGGSIDLCVGASGPREVEFRVCDCGTGIPPEIRTRVFDLLVRGQPRFDFRNGRVGCGLTLVQRIAAVHGGRAEVRRSTPQGSEVVLTVPSAAASSADGRSIPTN